MKNIILSALTIIVVIAGCVFGLSQGIVLDELQLETMKVLLIMVSCSAAYCFIVGEISRNNSQMDKLWSLLPIAYAWVIAAKGGMKVRLVVMALIITFWGGRLTYNFAKKGAYSLRFWEGEEDYRWPILRQHKLLKNKLAWALFDLIFISIYQNALVLFICFPMVAVMSTSAAFSFMDVVAALLMIGAVTYETIADKQQMAFQTKKWAMIKEGKKLEELPQPYCKGFNTTGLWARSRHPNYFAEQSTWVFLYLFCIGAGVTHHGVFHWSIFGCLMLILLFMGSSMFGESVSSKKYPLYAEYQKTTPKYFPKMF